MKTQLGWLIGLSVLISQCLLASAQPLGVTTKYARATASASWSGRQGMATTPVNVAPRSADPDFRSLLIGGRHQTSETTSEYFNDVWVSNANGSSWTLQTVGPWQPRHGGKVVNIPQHGPITQGLIFTGGEAGGIFFNDVWRSDDLGVSWYQLNWPHYSPRKDFELVAANHYGGTAGIGQPCSYLLGGEGPSGVYNDAYMYCAGWSTLTWVGNCPFSARARFASASISGGAKVIVLGGQQQDGSLQDDVWFWDLAAGGYWTEYSGQKGHGWNPWFPKVMNPTLLVSRGVPLSEHSIWLAAGTIIPTDGPDAGRTMPLPYMYGLQHPAATFPELYIYTIPDGDYMVNGYVAAFPIRLGAGAVMNPTNNFVMYFGGSSNETVATSYNDVWTTYLWPLETQQFQW